MCTKNIDGHNIDGQYLGTLEAQIFHYTTQIGPLSTDRKFYSHVSLAYTIRK